MLSVVILTYDSARTIERCIGSLLDQTERPKEILLVDDDSRDQTVLLATATAQQGDIPLSVIRNGTHNISHGRNLGLDAATGPIVAFLDSDAYAEPDWAAALLRSFREDPAVAVVGGDVLPLHASAFAHAVAVNDATVRDLFTRGVLLVSGCNMAVDTRLTDGCRFDERWVHAEDVEFVNRLGMPWRVDRSAQVHHESRVRPRQYLRQMFRYGYWKVRYTARTGQVRLVDFVPSVVFVSSAILAATWSPWSLLLLPGLCLAETAFVGIYRRPAWPVVPLMLVGWTVKNVGWGSGVLVGVASQGADLVGDRRPQVKI